MSAAARHNPDAEIDRAARTLGVAVNDGQRQALREILQTVGNRLYDRQPHLLTGAAGTGKTTVLQVLAIILQRRRLRFSISAPTHKAVAVLASKLKRAKIADVPCLTTQSLLSLVPKPHGDRLVFERRPNAPPVMADVVAVDECSMIDRALMAHIYRWLPVSIVLFCGDPAQLPPVGERASEAFLVERRSHLAEVVRQEADNPVLAAAYAIRDQQGGPMNWDWLRPVQVGRKGIFIPREPDEWMRKAFTSAEFDAAPDTFRVVAYTNKRVASINAKVRQWRYGDVGDQPFVAGERAMLRAPIIKDDSILAATNEEPVVLAIDADEVPASNKADPAETVATWRLRLRNDDGLEFDAHLVRDERAHKAALGRLADAAKQDPSWWPAFHTFKQRFMTAQAIYALTTHNAQGSTHRHTFVDIGDIARRAATNQLECQQLLYVAASRPTDTLIAVGI